MLFLQIQIQCIKIVHRNIENKVVVLAKRMEIIISIQACLISRMNFNYKENGGKKKLFMRNQSINIMYPNEENVFIVSNCERADSITRIQILSYLMYKH